jgi:hypothetical protein
MGKKHATTVAVLVALAAFTIASPATAASARRGAAACAGQRQAHRAVARATAGGARARRPVAMVPGLRYDPRTMIPRAICRAGAYPFGI